MARALSFEAARADGIAYVAGLQLHSRPCAAMQGCGGESNEFMHTNPGAHCELSVQPQGDKPVAQSW